MRTGTWRTGAAMVLVLLSGSPAAAQTQVGFFGGVVESAHRLGELTDRPTLGLVVRRDLVDELAFEANAAYIRRGFKNPDDGRELKSEQAELALLAQVRPMRWGTLSPVVLAGVSFSREIYCSARGSTGPDQPGPVLCEVFRDRPYDFGRVGGIGLEVDGEVWTVRLEFRRIGEIAPDRSVRATARRVSGYYLTFTRDPCFC